MSPATPDDIPILLEMMEAFYAIDGYPFDKKLTEENLHLFIQNDQLGKIWLIKDNVTTIGYIVLAFGFSFEFKGRDAFIDEFYLTAGYRGKGIGKEVIAFVSAEAPKLGVKALHLEVEHHNQNAKKLYFNQGFTDNNRGLLTKWL